MDRRSWERRGGIAGVGAVAVDFLGILIGGRGIAIDGDPQSLANRYVELGVRPALHALCICMAMILLLWFAASIRSVITREEGAGGPLASVFFGSAVCVFAVEFVRAAVLATLSLRAEDLSADAVTLLHVVSQVIGPITAFPLAAGLVALALVVRGSNRLPQWIGPWSFVVAAVWALSSVRVLTTSTAAWSASIVAFIAYAAGVIAIGVAMAQGRLAAEAVQQ